MKRVWQRLVLAVLVAGPMPVRAADAPMPLQDFAVRTWTKEEEGLPDNSVMAVLQTRDGYLWVGTQHGLARFDGVRFVPIGLADATTNAVLNVTALCEDAAGRLWIGTQGGGLFCCSSGIVTRLPENQQLAGVPISAIAEDMEGHLWVGTAAGLVQWGDGRISRFTVKEGLPSDAVSNVSVARSGTVWITTAGGMCQYKEGRLLPVDFRTESSGRSPEFLGVYEDRQGNLWAFGDTYLVNLAEGKRVNYFRSGDTPSVRIWSLCEGRNGLLWIGTSGQGLFCFAGDRFLPLTLRAGGVSSDVRALCEDREGNLWLGTGGAGLVRLQPRAARLLDATDGVPSGSAKFIMYDALGTGWAGFGSGGLYASRSGRFEPAADDLRVETQNLLSSACMTADRTLWLGTLGAGLYCRQGQQTIRYTMADGLSDDVVLVTASNPEGAVWVGTRAGGLHRFLNGRLTSFGGAAGLPGQAITAVLPGREVLWIGTENGRLLREEAGRFRPADGAETLEGKPIRALCEDRSGRLWVGSEGGLACVTEGRCTSWGAQEGIPGPAVVGLLSDDAGNLWLGTGPGVYRISGGSLRRMLAGQSLVRAQVCFHAGGFTNAWSPAGFPRVAQLPDGRIGFATVAGVVLLNPLHLAQAGALPSVFIEGVFVNGERFVPGRGPGAPLQLSPNLRSLEIQFTVPYLTGPEKVRFRHKLEGFDVDWVDDGAERRVRYGRLPNGRYEFHVRADSADGAWHEAAANLNFVIPTPLWRTGWALGLYGMAVTGAVAVVVRWASHRRLRAQLARLAQQEAMQKERMRIAQDMHDDIGSKLTKISFMSERARGELPDRNPVAAKLDAIATTSRDLLKSLDEIVWAVNPRNDDLEHLAAYLGQYATEYFQNTAVECELRMPRHLPQHPLSAELRHNVFLAFEEALNNVLKHARASLVRVNMTMPPARFEITVADNGQGFDAPAEGPEPTAVTDTGDQDGLRNMRQRLAEVSGQCAVRSEPGQGTTVVLGFPLATDNTGRT